MQPNVQITAYDFADTALDGDYKKILKQEIYSLSEDECELVLNVLKQMRTND